MYILCTIDTLVVFICKTTQTELINKKNVFFSEGILDNKYQTYICDIFSCFHSNFLSEVFHHILNIRGPDTSSTSFPTSTFLIRRFTLKVQSSKMVTFINMFIQQEYGILSPKKMIKICVYMKNSSPVYIYHVHAYLYLFFK